VNKGNKSAECVKFARENNILCTRGNHDDAILYYIDRKRRTNEDYPKKY
jgi:metallophosphoesterase superfamily enzyme